MTASKLCLVSKQAGHLCPAVKLLLLQSLLATCCAVCCSVCNRDTLNRKKMSKYAWSCVIHVIAQLLSCCLQKYQDDLSDLPNNNGLQSTLYSVLTVALVGAGALYLLQPQVCVSCSSLMHFLHSLTHSLDTWSWGQHWLLAYCCCNGLSFQWKLLKFSSSMACH